MAVITYPSPIYVLLLSLLAFPLAQFFVFPMVASFDDHLGLIAAEFSLLLVLLIFIWHHRWTVEDLFLTNATHPTVLLGTIAAAFGGSLLVAEIDLISGWVFDAVDFDMPVFLQQDLLELQIVREYSEIGKVVTALVIAPGICEEIFFRGFVFVVLTARYGTYIGGFVSALLFAIVHLNPWQFPALFLFGGFLALLVCWTHSIYPAIIAHMINNAISVVGINGRVYSGIDPLGSAQFLSTPVLLIAVFLMGVGIYFIRAKPPIMPLILAYDQNTVTR